MDKIRLNGDDQVANTRLQMNFFNNTQNTTRDRILSAQYLLKIRLPVAERIDIETDLRDIAMTSNYSENIRADAIDVLLRDGFKEQVNYRILERIRQDAPLPPPVCPLTALNDIEVDRPYWFNSSGNRNKLLESAYRYL